MREHGPMGLGGRISYNPGIDKHTTAYAGVEMTTPFLEGAPLWEGRACGLRQSWKVQRRIFNFILALVKYFILILHPHCSTAHLLLS
jgi:hypothetical protein